MHEMRVAREILEFSECEMRRRGFAKLIEIGIRVGQLSCIDPDSLKFAFDVLKKETTLPDAELKIENVPILAVCQSCGSRFEVEGFVFICPQCRSSDVEVEKGEELVIEYITAE